MPDYIPAITGWPGIKSIARIEAIRETQGKRTAEIGYLIGSMEADASAVQLRNAAANLGVVCKLALNLFRLDTTSGLSLPRKRKNAAWNSDYLFDLLDIQPKDDF